MPPSPSKTQHKKVGKEKGLDSEKKTRSPGDSTICGGRLWEVESKGQLKGKESLPKQGDSLEEDPLKSQRLVRLQGSKENCHKKLLRRRGAYKRNAKRGSVLGRQCGERLVSKLEGKKGKGCKQQEMPSGQESEDSSDEEEQATINSKKHTFNKCGKCPAVSEKATESPAVQSAGGSLWKHNSPQRACNARLRAKHDEDPGFKEAAQQKSSSQSRGSVAQGKGERTEKKQVGKQTRMVVTESAEENILETSNNSCSDSSNEGRWTHRKGTEEAVADSTASNEEKSSSSEEDGHSEKEAMCEDPPVAEGKGYKELFDESSEASNETEREQVTTVGRNESGDGGTDFTGFESERKMKKQDDMARQLKSILAESSEEGDGSISGFQLKTLKNREYGNNEVGKENISENDRVQGMSKDAHDHSESSGENSAEESIDKGKETNQPLPSAVKAELHVHLGKVLQGTEQEEKVNDEGSSLEHSPSPSKQQMIWKEKSGRREAAEQGEVVGHIRRDGSLDCSKQDVAAMMLTKKCSSQSQIPFNLKKKYKNAEPKLLTSCKPNPVQMALETNSDLKNVESICSKPMTLETLRAQKESDVTQCFGEKRLNISSCSTLTKKSSDKQLLGKRNKVGKVIREVKLSSGQTLEAKKEKAEEGVAEAPSEKENVHDGKGSKYLHTHSAFRKVTSWLGQKPAKKASLKARLLSVARAIGISRWILKTFGKRKRSRKPFGFSSRVAIQIVSAAGWAGQSGKPFPGAAEQLGRAELSDTESSPPLVEKKGGPKTAEEVGHIDLPSGDFALHGTSSFPYLLSLDEENNNATDAKFAVVFPRVHSMVKKKSSLSRGSGNGYSLEEVRALSDRKSVTPVQQGCRFKCDLPRSLMHQGPQRQSEQGFLPRGEEDPIHTLDYSSEVDVKQGSSVLQTAESIVTSCVHWSRRQAQECDPAAWLNAELLLPRLTIENLSKWAMYADPHVAKSHLMKVCKDQWEAEDVADNALEMEFVQEQVQVLSPILQ